MKLKRDGTPRKPKGANPPPVFRVAVTPEQEEKFRVSASMLELKLYSSRNRAAVMPMLREADDDTLHDLSIVAGYRLRDMIYSVFRERRPDIEEGTPLFVPPSGDQGVPSPGSDATLSSSPVK